MNGMPMFLNTPEDYEYIRAAQLAGWQDKWLGLLEGRFMVVGDDLVEDGNAPIFRLGFTVQEVAEAIAFSGYTAREYEWFTSQPNRFELIEGHWQQKEGWAAQHAAEVILTALNQKLAEVDSAVSALQSGTFDHLGHKYYLDRDYISDQIVALPLLPAAYTREWKTADKIGVENVYVTLDKSGIMAMGMACFEQFNANWSKGDAIKKQLKSLYAQGQDVSSFVVKI